MNDIKLSANINVKKFVKLKNLIGDGINVSGSNINITQIGIHARPGTLMCINGEEIRVGRSGLYEILNGYKVTFIGFIVEPNDNKHFMLDYQY